MQKLKAAQTIAFDDTGPSTSQTPYIVPVARNVETLALLSVGDQVGTKDGPRGFDGEPWRMVGIPDGLGAYDNGDGTFTVLMNHELSATLGVPREHGRTGAFISELTIDKETLEVTNGEDLVQDVFFYHRDIDSFVEDVPFLGTAEFGRLCSADLAPVSAFFDASSGLGTQARIFLNGEEIGPEGRAFGHVATGGGAGKSFELAYLGRFSWENALANPDSGAKTVVIGTDDSTPGEVYLYAGDKKSTGNAVEKAGLNDGELYGIAASFGDDPTATPGQGRFKLIAQGDDGDVSDTTGAELQAESARLTQFGRPEDGAWDPSDPNRFYLVTTGNNAVDATGTSAAIPAHPTRLWAMDFKDVERPELGGTIKVLVEGGFPDSDSNSPLPIMLDNMTVTESGLVVMQEDPGNNPRLARVWMYDPNEDTRDPGGTSGLTLLARHDPDRFREPAGSTATPAPGTTTGFGQDEESSGIVDVTDVLGGDRLAFLLDTQAHYAIDTDPFTPGTQGELVEGGQLMTMSIDLPNPGDSTFEGSDRANRYDGGFGDDSLQGNAGNDTLLGNYGDDIISGGLGADSIDGGVGADLIAAGAGNDRVAGGTDDDGLRGQEGDDTVAGGVGDDTVNGGDGQDVLSGEFGDDSLLGGDNRDTLAGDQGDDTLEGGAGVDVLAGGGGRDLLRGGGGDDRFQFTTFAQESDRIADFAEGDRIVLDVEGPTDQVRFIGFEGRDDAAGPGPTLRYSDATGRLFFDETGGNRGDEVLLATLIGSPGLDRGDVLFV